MSGPVDVLAVIERCQAYVDDAAQFPEQFKPGVVQRDQREYREAFAAVAQFQRDVQASLAMLAADGLEDAPVAGFLRAALARAGGA